MDETNEPTVEEEAPPIHQLIYASAATQDLSDEDLESILEAARRNNTVAQVTGMLVYHEGSFLQVLEGEREIVEALFDRIESDPRHTSAMVLLRAEVPERGFDQWSMGFYRTQGSDVRALPGLNDFLRRGFTDRNATEHGEAARKILSAFREGRWRRRVEAGEEA
ncbi:MAG: BLUF domain-containing protein [Proteobacteria bacterium]|nr:BLUF domain-containing protein [Pseudomonadota bacterium]